MGMAEVTAVFGWMTLINLAVYLVAVAMIVFARECVIGLQARMLGVPEDAWPRIYVDYLARYKIAILVFNLAPYLALRIVG